MTKDDARTGPREVEIKVGELHAAAEPTIIRTLLGSCVSICLFDPTKKIGGMNHFMLPSASEDSALTVDARFGDVAMKLLIKRILGLGAEISNLHAKIFGGGHVIEMRESGDAVPRRNIEFAEEFLAARNIVVDARDVGGKFARRVAFSSHTGMARVSKIDSNHGSTEVKPGVRNPEVRSRGNDSSCGNSGPETWRRRKS